MSLNIGYPRTPRSVSFGGKTKIELIEPSPNGESCSPNDPEVYLAQQFFQPFGTQGNRTLQTEGEPQKVFVTLAGDASKRPGVHRSVKINGESLDVTAVLGGEDDARRPVALVFSKGSGDTAPEFVFLLSRRTTYLSYSGAGSRGFILTNPFDTSATGKLFQDVSALMHSLVEKHRVFGPEVRWIFTR
jgi:hypothetical protein